MGDFTMLKKIEAIVREDKVRVTSNGGKHPESCVLTLSKETPDLRLLTTSVRKSGVQSSYCH
jgi:hypothetical protein